MFDHARKTIDDDSATPIARALLAAAENDTLVAPDHKVLESAAYKFDAGYNYERERAFLIETSDAFFIIEDSDGGGRFVHFYDDLDDAKQDFAEWEQEVKHHYEKQAA